MERQSSISEVILLLLVHHTMTTTNHTYNNNEHMSTTPMEVRNTHTDPWQLDTAQLIFQTPSQGHGSLTLTGNSQSASFTTPSLSNITINCPLVFENTLTERTGVIAFTQPQEHCSETWKWNIHLPPEDGIILQFNDIKLNNNCTMEIISFRHFSGGVRQRESSFIPRETFHSLRLNTSVLQVVIEMSEPSMMSTPCFVNISYSAYPAQKMAWWFHPSSDLYVCSEDLVKHSVSRCNMVQECAGNEDEADCDYTHQGCGSWVPFRDLCLKLDFILHPYQDHTQTIPDAAAEACSSRYEARLVQLKGSDDVDSLGRIIGQAGFTTAVIGMQKIKPMSRRHKHLYRFLWQWGDRGSPIAYLESRQMIRLGGNYRNCVHITVKSTSQTFLNPVKCHQPRKAADGYICMKPNPSHSEVKVGAISSLHLPKEFQSRIDLPTRECSDGSYVQNFHSCYSGSKQDMTSSPYRFPLFPCSLGPPVHYTVVCDGNDDCVDSSDEKDCGEARFSTLLHSMFRCENFQLVPQLERCDGKYDCFDDSDEVGCTFCRNNNHRVVKNYGCMPWLYNILLNVEIHNLHSLDEKIEYPKPAMVMSDGFGTSVMLSVSDTSELFECKDGNYYIGSHLLNNGELDCSSGEDENIPMENITCPGFYRCFISKSCVYPSQICDGIHHCPYKDDERYCDFVCPEECLCEGYAFSCTQFSNIPYFLQVRYLDLSGSVNISLSDMHYLELLQILNLSYCGLDVVYLRAMPQLRGLDLSFNKLKNLSSFVFEGLSGAKYLNISGNPLFPIADNRFRTTIQLSSLNNLQYLVMRHTGVNFITDRAFGALTRLETLDIRNSFIEDYDREIFWGLRSLQQLYIDDSRLCCPYFHDTRVVDCVAPFDELSSCSDLLRQNFFRIFLWLVIVLAIVGNASVMLYQLFAAKLKTLSASHVLGINLCFADLLMGMYLLMVGIADAHFKGEYVEKEKAWKRSTVCDVAGFLGFVSNEASAMTVCLITLDRVLVLCFPLKSRFHLTVRSSVAACGVLWFVVVTLAALPLMAGLEFYGVSSVCLPLPITSRQFSGQFHFSGIFIIFNFVLFAVIGLGQIFIYRAILSAGKAAGTSSGSQKMAITRRLFLVILSDFCCWFLIGIMGLLVANGKDISGEMNVWMAIYVIPFNSALNPVLYTLNYVLEIWKEEKLRKETNKMLGHIQTTLLLMPPSTAEQFVRICIQSDVVKREKILHMLQGRQERTVSACDT